jgi:hypothetical protein
MANYTDFQPALAGWLKKVWDQRKHIKSGAAQLGHAEGAWRVYDLYNDPGKVATDAFEEFKRCIAEFEDEYDVQIKSQTGQDIPDDFYHMEPPDYDSSKSNSRIYVKVVEPIWLHALLVALEVLELRKKHRGFQKLKVAGPGMSPNRGDSVVVWLTDDVAVRAFLLDMVGEDFLRHYGAETLPGIKRVRPGLGWADEPPKTDPDHPVTKVFKTTQHSFGSYLAGFIYLALNHTWSKSEGAYLDKVLSVFAFGKIDPKNPSNVTMTSETLDFKEHLANTSIVLHTAKTGDLITYDVPAAKNHTKPLQTPSSLHRLKVSAEV